MIHKGETRVHISYEILGNIVLEYATSPDIRILLY